MGHDTAVQTLSAHLIARSMSADQAMRLSSVHFDQYFHLSERETLASLASRINAVLSEPVVIFVARRREWSIRAAAPGTLSPSIEHIAQTLSQVAEVRTPTAIEWLDGDEAWTLVGCRTRPSMVIAIGGCWASYSPVLLLMAKNVAFLWSARRATARARSRLSALRLTRRLSQSSGLQPVHEAIVEGMATAVNARIAALAVPDPSDHRLSIVATYGYAHELVEHLRIEPRAGTFGSVYQSGQAVLVQDATTLSDFRRPRPRYRTRSFVGVPIKASSEVLG